VGALRDLGLSPSNCLTPQERISCGGHWGLLQLIGWGTSLEGRISFLDPAPSLTRGCKERKLHLTLLRLFLSLCLKSKIQF
jgi:hypothetical protein